MKLLQAEQVLLEALDKEKVNNYSVSVFCREMHMNRITFYKAYRNISGLFQDLLMLKIDKAINFTDYNRIEKIVESILREMEQHKWLYVNMSNVCKNCICWSLEKQFANSFIKYMDKRGAYSVSEIRMISNCMFSMLYSWVQHEMAMSSSEMYLRMRLLIRELNKQGK